ncbi:hypothetical protein BH10BAC1_BH10BAC1_14950 [soil metagenome]
MVKKYSFLCLFFLSSSLLAQKDTAVLDDYYIDFTPPDLSAFQLLGTSQNEVARPSSLKELTTGIMAFNNKGEIAPGVALEWSPGYTISGRQPNISDYRTNYLLYAIQITGATASDSTGTNAAFGLKWTPVNKTDIINDKLFGKQIMIALNKRLGKLLSQSDSLQDELTQYIAKKLNIKREIDPEKYLLVMNLFPSGINSESQEINKQFVKSALDSMNIKFPDKDLDYFVKFYNQIILGNRTDSEELAATLKSIKEKWLQDHWNSSVFLLSAGLKMNSTDSRWDGLKSQKIVGCINYAYPLGKVAQNIWQIKNNYYVSGDTINKNEFYVGTRLLIGNQSTRFSIEGSYNNYTSKISSRNDERLKVTVGLEFKLSDGLWFEIAGGIDQSVKTGSKPVSIGSGNFKYALQKKRRF